MKVCHQCVIFRSVVASNSHIFENFPPRKLGKIRSPFWRAYFSKGLVQPPTSQCGLSPTSDWTLSFPGEDFQGEDTEEESPRGWNHQLVFIWKVDFPNISCLARPQHSFFLNKVDDSQDSFAIITWKKLVIFCYHLLYVRTFAIHIHIFESRNIDGEKKSVGGGQWKQLLNQVHCTQIPRITVDLRRNASVWYYGELVLTKPPTTHGKTRELQLNLKAPLHT